MKATRFDEHMRKINAWVKTRTKRHFLKEFSLFYAVFATTAANTHESSYACYLDEERNTYLGDVYSVKWMEDSDKVRNMQRE